MFFKLMVKEKIVMLKESICSQKWHRRIREDVIDIEKIVALICNPAENIQKIMENISWCEVS